MRQLRLPRPKLPKRLRNRHRLNPPTKQTIQYWRSRRNLHNILPFLHHFIPRNKHTFFDFPRSFDNFIDFGFVDAFYVAELFAGGHADASDGAETGGFELGDVGGVDALLLEFVDLGEEDGVEVLFLFLLLLAFLH